LILGASGSVGTYALQLAKYYGATITAVSSEKNHQVMLSIGADHVIDYQVVDVTNLPKKYDIIFDAVGQYKKNTMKKMLEDKGKFLSIKYPTKEKIERLEAINDIVKHGKLQTVIDQVYPFKEYKEAHSHVYTKHKLGNVLIDIQK